MSRHLLLLAVSRSLADDPDAAAWARRQLDRVLDGTRPGDAVLTDGDGPASSLLETCAARGLRLIEYRDDGRRYENGVPGKDNHHRRGDGRAQAMIHGASAAASAGWHIYIIALIDPHASTDNARALVKTAREAVRAFSEIIYMDSQRETETPVVWIDVETTGRSAGAHSVIEVAAILCSPNSRVVRGEYEARIRLERWMLVEPEALRVNGYSERGWADARSGETVFNELAAWLPERFTLAAFSAAFDRGFLRAEFERCRLPEPGWLPTSIDPLPVARNSLRRTGAVPDCKLTTLCSYYGLPTIGAHAARNDAHRARLVYLALMGEDIAQHVKMVMP